MSASSQTVISYPIHQAINRPIGFRGLKAQYIVLTAAALVGDLLLFVVLYIAGLTPWVDIAIVFGIGVLAISTAIRLGKRYGEYGLMKKMARKRVPPCLKCASRQLFLNLKNQQA